MREAYSLSLADGSKQEIPLSLLNTWVRKRLLRVYSYSDDNPVGVLREVKANPLTTRLINGATIVAHPSIAKGLKPVTLGEMSASGDGRPSHAARASKDSQPPLWVSGCVRYAGKELVVISKPESIASQGGTGTDERRTVDYWLPAIDAAAGAATLSSKRSRSGSTLPEAVDLKLVHRLDKDVSGLLLLARGRDAAERIRMALSGRFGVRKEYIAVVEAPLPRGVRPSGVIDAPVTEGPPHAHGKGAAQQMQQQAMTEYVAVELRGAAAGAAAGAASAAPRVAAPASASAATAAALPPLTLLLLRPVTGRKHQLRQHVRALFRGTAAISGDRKYGVQGQGGPATGRGPLRSAGSGSRLLLHAWRLTIDSDVLGEDGENAATVVTRNAATMAREGCAAESEFVAEIRRLVTQAPASKRQPLAGKPLKASQSPVDAGKVTVAAALAAHVARTPQGGLQVTDTKLPDAFCAALRPYFASPIESC